MALLTTIKCRSCSKTKHVSYNPSDGAPSICDQCEAEEKAKIKTKYLEKLSFKTLEQRVRLIEEYIYDNAQNKQQLFFSDNFDYDTKI